MVPEIIPLDRAERPTIGASISGPASVVERFHSELARVVELQRRTEQELETLRQNAMAQDKLATLGRLAACTVHEINQPLSFLKIFCQSIIREAGTDVFLSPQLAYEAREACRQIDRIQQMTQRMLGFSRPETESFTALDVMVPWERAQALMNPQLRRQGVAISERREDALSPILGNSGRLEQLFVNLLQNAIDALAVNQREKKIHVCFTQQKRHLLITFRDNGPGVPDTIRERIFEPFFTTKESGQGTGLGLAIIAEIVRDHQGSIQLNTRRQKGTEFTIKFPVWRGDRN